MASLPRIVTVDPTGTVSQVVRAAVRLMEGYIIQIDSPTADDAVSEVKRGDCTLVVSSWELDGGGKGWQLAAGIKKASDTTPLLILAGETDPEVDEETQLNENAPFFYMQRPKDNQKFLRAIETVLTGGNIAEALQNMQAAGDTPVAAGGGSFMPLDLGPVPTLDVNASRGLVNNLLQELGAMAIMVASRDGEVLMEFGATGYVDREKLAKGLIPSVMTHVNMQDISGTHTGALLFYDGENFDIFVLSVGLHHFMTVVFDGERGQKQFGAVTRYGRRACEDLIAMIPGAWMIQKAEPMRPKPVKLEAPKVDAQDEFIQLETASFGAQLATPEPTVAVPKMEAIPDDQFNLDDIFGGGEAGDLNWDLSEIENIAKEGDTGSMLDFDTAIKLGVLPKDQ